MPDPVQSLIAEQFLRGLRVATLAVTAAVLCLWHLPVALSFAGSYRSDRVEFGALAVLVAVTIVGGAVVLLDRPWGPLRWPLVAVALAATVAATAAVEPADLVLAPHWSWKVFGWFAVLLLMDLPLRWFFAALGVQQAITAVQVLAAGRTDASTLVELGVTGLLVGAWQSAVALAAVALRRSAAAAGRVAAEEEELRTAERVAEQLHTDRHERYGGLAVTTAPLLAGLASGDLDPGDPRVQRACAVEAARMRRLFAESDDVPEPLEHELHACIDVAERRGIAVHLSVRGALPPIPLPVRRALTEPAIAALADARSVARVTVVGVDDRVTMSVVTDGAGHGSATGSATTWATGWATARSPGGTRDVRVTQLVGDDKVWLEATWTPTV
jgi:hypothetical protein